MMTMIMFYLRDDYDDYDYDYDDFDDYVLPEGASKSAAKVATAEYCDCFSILSAVDDHDILR